MRRFVFPSFAFALFGCAAILGLPDPQLDDTAGLRDAASTMDGDVTDASSMPDALVDAGPRVVAIAAGGSFESGVGMFNTGDHTCAIVAPGGHVYCWGANERGQLGVGDMGPSTDRTTATRLELTDTNVPFDGIDEISIAAWHGCARRAQAVFCWGERESGSVGDGTVRTNNQPAPPATRPKPVANVDAKRIGVGTHHSCAVLANGRAKCWGSNTFRQLGHGTAFAGMPGDVPCLPFFDPSPNAMCNATPTEVTGGDPSIPDDDLVNAETVAGGDFHTCALTTGALTRCWGRDTESQLSQNGPVPGGSTAAPHTVRDRTGQFLVGVVEIAPSPQGKHHCVRTASNVLCWGLNNGGQAGDVSDAGVVPGAVGFGVNASVAIAAGSGNSCAIRPDKTLACWGFNADGQLARTPTPGKNAPTTIERSPGVPLANVVAVAPGFLHVCALVGDGSVWCWGRNARGQLGNGTRTDSFVPVRVQGLP